MENLSSQTNLISATQLYSSRWIVVVIFSITCAINFFQDFQFSIISNIVESYYGVDSNLVKLSGMVFMIYFLILFVPASILIEKITLKKIMILSSGLNALGNLLKLLGTSPGTFYIILISQSLCAIAQIFVVIIPTKVASVWFGADEVSTACAIGILGGQIGVALGSVIPTVLVKDSEDINSVKADFHTLFLYNAIISVVIFILVILFFKSKPPTPPSQSQIDLQTASEERSQYWPTIKKLSKNKDFAIVLFSIGVNYSFYSCSGIMLNEIWTTYFPDEKSVQDLGLVNFASLISGGCIGSMIFGYILDKTHKFKLVTFVVLAANLVSTIGVGVFLLTGNKIGTFIALPTSGFFSGSLMVIAYEYATEITYPIPETVGASILNVVDFVFSLSFIVALTFIFESVGHVIGFAVLIVGMAIGTFTMLLINPELKRRDANLKAGERQAPANYS